MAFFYIFVELPDATTISKTKKKPFVLKMLISSMHACIVLGPKSIWNKDPISSRSTFFKPLWKKIAQWTTPFQNVRIQNWLFFRLWVQINIHKVPSELFQYGKFPTLCSVSSWYSMVEAFDLIFHLPAP